MSLIYLPNMEIIYWSIRSFSRRGGDGIKVIKREIVILACYVFHFIREHEIWCKIQVIINPFQIFNLFLFTLCHKNLYFSGIQRKLDKGLRPGTVTQGVMSMTKKVQLVTSKLDQAHDKAKEIESVVIDSIAFDNRYCHALTLTR